jgi:uncharacterized protein YbcV (DUF1398 family)
MFTIEQVKAAHSKVKTGADFPKYIAELGALGVRRYVNYVADGHTDYEGTNTAEGPAKYATKIIASVGDIPMLRRVIKVHQDGGSDYPTVCQQAADAGVNTWIVDIGAMTCTYYDTQGQEMLVEKIPG